LTISNLESQLVGYENELVTIETNVETYSSEIKKANSEISILTRTYDDNVRIIYNV
jgi:hypothetical protein